MKFQNREPQPAAMQMAPMIDIVFLLLIFFIVTWQYSRDEVLPIKLPASEEGAEPQRVLGEIMLNVQEDGTVSVWGESRTQAQLKEILMALVDQHPDQPIRVRGDANTPYQEIVKVIDICQQSGVWNISFATQRPPDS